LEATIDGNTAQVRVPLPREDFISPPPNQITALGRWSGAMLAFKQVNGDWKLDTDGTFNFIASIARQPGNNTSDLAVEGKILTELADGLVAVASDIESGKITARQRAISGVEAAARRAFQDAHVDGSAVATLPVVGG